MGVVEIVRDTAVPAARLWEVVTDWPRHGLHVLLTELTVDGEAGVAQVVDAVTTLGPIAIHDPMRVTIWEPPVGERPGRVHLLKTGRWLAGFADIEVASTPTGSRVVWREYVVPRPERVGRLLAPVADPLTRRLFGSTVDALVREAGEPA